MRAFSQSVQIRQIIFSYIRIPASNASAVQACGAIPRHFFKLMYFYFSHCEPSRMSPAHCSAMAFAMPGNVFARFLARSVVNMPLCLSQCCLEYEPDGHHVLSGVTMFVGINAGTPRSHRSVFLVNGSPYSYGCIVCVGSG